MVETQDTVWLPSDGLRDLHMYEVIASSKLGSTYKIRKKKTIRYFALQCTDKDQHDRLMREVKSLHALDHPNIIKFYMWYETRSHLWTITEYCVGGNLGDILKQDGKIPEEAIRGFARDLATALQFLHSNGILHCSLCPSNVLLNEDGCLKLIGFGQSRAFADAAKKFHQHEDVGNDDYAAPELDIDDSVHSIASDLWSLGCILYQMAFGRSPPARTSKKHSAKHPLMSTRSFEVHGSAGISDNLWSLLSALLVENPSERATWEAIARHSYWHEPIVSLPMPNQPEFAKMLSSPGYLSKFGKVMHPEVPVSKTPSSFERKSSGAESLSQLQPSCSGLSSSGEAQSRSRASSDAQGILLSNLGSSSDTAHDGTAESLQALRSLIWQKQDTIVKSIVSVKKSDQISRLPPPSLQFAVHSRTQLQNLTQSQGRRFITNLIDAVHDSSLDKQTGALEYVDSICSDSVVANMITNSAFTEELISIVKDKGLGALRLKAISLMGSLVRHSTRLGPDFTQLGLMNFLVIVVKKDDVKIQRRAMACLGELIFFAVSQQEDGEGASQWTGVDSAVAFVWTTLTDAPDDLIQQAALRTLENLAVVGQTSPCTSKLRSETGVSVLLALIASQRTSIVSMGLACSLLSKMLRASPDLLALILSHDEHIRLLISVLSKDGQEMRSACLGIFCELLTNLCRLPAIPEAFKETEWTETLTYIMSTKSSLSAGKAMVAHALTVRCCPLEVCYPNLLEVAKLVLRAEHSEDRYLVSAAAAWMLQLPQFALDIVKQGVGTCDPAGRQCSKSAGSVLPVLLGLLSMSSDLCSRAASVDLLAEIMDKILSSGDQTQMELMRVLEALMGSQESIDSLANAWTSRALPALSSLISLRTGKTEIKFAALQLLQILLPQLMRASPEPNDKKDDVSLEQALEQHVLPSLQVVLASRDDLLPIAGLKLVLSLLEEKPDIATQIDRLGMVDVFLEMFDVSHPNNRTANVKICRILLEQDIISAESLVAFNLSSKVGEILECAQDESADHFLVPVLAFLGSLIKAAGNKRPNSLVWEDELLEIVGLSSHMCSLAQHQDDSAAAEAASCIVCLFHALPEDMKQECKGSSEYTDLRDHLSKQPERTLSENQKQLLKALQAGE